MAQTIEDVNSRTLLQQFHELYNKQNETETDVENLDAKIDQETLERQTTDLSINSEIQALRDEIESLGVLFTYKGEVATIQDLPVTDNKPGDVYYVDSEQSGYVWLEKSGVYQWEEFGPAIDLSEYAKQEDLEQLESEVDAMNTQVENNTSNIVSLSNAKQDKLTAGTNITIDENNVISSSGGLQEVKASDVNSESATSGQVLTADGNGGASWGNVPTPSDVVTTTDGNNYFPQSKTFTFANNAIFKFEPSGGWSSRALAFNIKQSNPTFVINNGSNINTTFSQSNIVRRTDASTSYTYTYPNKNGTFALTSDIDAKVPDAPDTDGTYQLICVVLNGVKTYQWELITSSGGSEP